MIRSRRYLHQGIFAALAVVVPGLLGVVLVYRPEVPPVAKINPSLMQQAGFPSPSDWRPRVVSTETGEFEVDVQPKRDAVADETWLQIRPKTVILKPDLLVYWTAKPQTDEKLSQDAILVGHLSGTSRRELRLPDAAGAGNGTILIYSMPHDEVITRFSLRDVIDHVDSGG